MKLNDFWYRVLVWVAVIAVAILLATQVKADIRVNLLTRLNEYVDDDGNNKMTEANKIVLLDATGREMGRALLYTKLDTVITTANTESYALNSDFAGAVKAAFVKSGTSRAYLKLSTPEVVETAPEGQPGEMLYGYLGMDARLVVKEIPLLAETLIVSYYATPSALSGDSTEWDLPDHYEDAALRICASKVLLKIGTSWADNKSTLLYNSGWADIERLRNPTPQVRQQGDTPSP